MTIAIAIINDSLAWLAARLSGKKNRGPHGGTPPEFTKGGLVKGSLAIIIIIIMIIIIIIYNNNNNDT